MKLAITILVIFLALVGLGFVFKFNGYNPDLAKPLPTPTPTPYVMTVKDTEKMLLAGAQIVFPKVINSEPAGIGDLPKELSAVIDPEANELSIEKLAYQGGKKGFRIGYLANSPMEQSYRRFIKGTSDWKLLTGSRALLAAVLESEAPKFFIRINQAVANQYSNSVIIQTVEK